MSIETIATSNPVSEARFAIVPMTSSASYPARRDNRHAERFARLVHPTDLLREVVRHLHAVRFVIGHELVPERAAREIERRRDVLRTMIAHQFPQHRDEHVHRVRGMALLIGQTTSAERVICAVHLRAAVDQEKRRTGHCVDNTNSGRFR